MKTTKEKRLWDGTRILNMIKAFFYKKLFPIDAIVLSFPKSGRTWLRTILAKYLELEYGIPFTLELNDRKIPRNLRIGFTHNLERLKELKGCKKILLFRDPRDVVVSQYHHCKNRSKTFDGQIHEFIRDEEVGIPRIIDFMNRAWEESGSREDCMTITYENLHKDTYSELRAIIGFLGFRIDGEKLKEAIKFSSFDKMQQMERDGKFNNWRLQSSNPKNKNAYKVRNGKIGNFGKELDSKDLEYVNKITMDKINRNLKDKIGLTGLN
ncbi:hypothetical protein GF415_03830 [Candidatus Micrarchaeota archaeon]|nr:hypothetical protein [Candidatus Micrarchaeota archaeon]